MIQTNGKWLDLTITVFGFEAPIYVFLVIAVSVLTVLFVIAKRGKKKEITTVPETTEKLSQQHEVVEDSTTQALQAKETTTKSQEDLSTEAILPEETPKTAEPVQVVQDTKQTQSNYQTLQNLIINLYALIPALRLFETLEGYKEQQVNTLDLRRLIDELLDLAGAKQIVINQSETAERDRPFDHALMQYLSTKVEKIDEAYKTRVFKPDQYLALGCYFYSITDFKKAEGLFDKAIEANRLNPMAWCNKAIVLRETERLDEALNAYTMAIELMPDNPTAWFGKATVLSDKGDVTEALNCIDRALQIDPLMHQAWYEKGLILSAEERFQEAIQCFDTAILINPKDERPWQAKGFALSCLNRHESACRAYEHSIAINPKDEESWYGRAIALSYLGHHEEAIRSFDFAIAINKGSYKAWFGKGLANFYLKRYDEALEAFKETLQINDGYARAWYHKAIVHCLCDQKDEAIRCLKRAVEIDSRYRTKAKNNEDFNCLRQDEEFLKLCTEDT